MAPIACENFATLCNNGSDKKKIPIGDCGKPLTYRGSPIHRVEKNFICQGGDFVKGNGSGGECVFGKRSFKDERPGLLTKHDRRGILAMGNSGKNSVRSTFRFHEIVSMTHLICSATRTLPNSTLHLALLLNVTGSMVRLIPVCSTHDMHLELIKILGS